ncbi:MAG: ATP-binding protein [Myxococcota bacterium]
MKTQRVLIVDDNASLVDNLRDVLADEAYDVVAVSSCAEALEAAHKGFQVAVVDVRLPDGNGTELAGRLKETSPDSEVILLTGFATVESAAAAVSAGAWAYLVKPYATPDLLLVIGQAMRHVELQEEKRELTQRTQIAERLAMVGTMTAGLSHEIRNPLNAALLQLTLAERRIGQLDASKRDPILEPLGIVRSEIQRLNRIVDDFLAFARPREVQRLPVELHTLFDKCFDLLTAAANEQGIALVKDAPSSLRIVGDEGRLHQVLMNLLLNALQATPRGGTVTLRAEATDREWVTINVDDSGPGVPPDKRDRIFEPFFTTKDTGSGLGLPLVHSTVSQHGGVVRVASSPEGGARFALTLPRAGS